MGLENQNVQRSAGGETAKVNVTWRPNGAGASPLNPLAAGNTVRRLARTGVGTWILTLRAGILVEAFNSNAITKRLAYLTDDGLFTGAAQMSGGTVANGELSFTITTTVGGAVADVAASANRWISVEIQAELSSAFRAPPDTLV